MAGPLIWNGLNAKALTRDILLSNTFFNSIRVGNQFSHNSSTGVESGGVLSINANPVLFDLTAGSGTFIDYTVPTVPTFKSITWNAFLAQTVTGLATQDETYILIDNTGGIIQQSNYPTPAQRRTNIFIGRIGHSSRTIINFANSFPDFSQSISSSTFDLFDALGPFNISGNQLASNGANLTFQKSTGSMFFRSFNYPINTYNPHTVTVGAQVPVSFFYRDRDTVFTPAVTAIDPTLYDPAGTPVAVPGGVNTSTIQRVYLAPNGVVQVQYGQTTYPTLAAAIASIGTDPFIQNPALTNVTILIGYIVVTRVATALNDPNNAAILRAPKFETGVGGGVNTVISLQQTYNSSTQPQIVLSSLGGLQIFDNAAPIGGNLLQVANNAGSTTYLGVTSAAVTVNQLIDSGLTANTAVVANASKQLTSSTTTSTQLGFLSNVTSDIQTQINTKQGTNLILDPLFESGTVSQWSKGTIGAITNGLPTGTPTFGSGSSANLTISAVTSGQIQGTTSLSYASSATNVQGDMMATGAIAVDPEYRTKVLGVKFAYQLIAGTADFSGTSTNSWAWALYDVTNANFIGTAGQFNLVQSSGVGICTGTVQIPSNTASVRFIIYNVKATTGATTIYFDDFYLGPQVSMQAPAMSDFVPYVPTITGFGTVSNVFATSRRVGDTLEFRVLFQAGTVTAAQGQVTLGYNGGNGNVFIDTSKLATNAPLGEVIQSGLFSSTFFTIYPLATSGTNNYFIFGIQTSTQPASNPANANTVTTNNAFVVIHGFAPIVGWSSNSVSSADTDTRVVAARLSGATTSIANDGLTHVVTFTTINYDTSGSATTGSAAKFTAPVTGYYDIDGWVQWGAATTGAISALSIIKNGGLYSQLYVTQSALTQFSTMQGSDVVFLNAGDFVQLAAQQAQAGGAVSLANAYMTITRRSGPAVITATESVNARYTNGAGQSIPNATSTIINYETKGYDSHNSMQVGAGYTAGTGAWATPPRYTAPVSGVYKVAAKIFVNANIFTVELFSIYKNGTLYTNLDYLQDTTNGSISIISGSDDIKLLAGEYIDIRYQQNTGSPINIHGDSNFNSFSVVRVGN